ncbi:MAG: hypothetical protein ABI369_00110 [Acetobacteraceae bacterium]
MVSQTVERVRDPAFLDSALEELRRSGFVTDEHDFAPYREAISTFAPEIEARLLERGTDIPLESGMIKNHPKAGYAYYIFDRNRFHSRADAERAISAWLDEAYAGPGE